MNLEQLASHLGLLGFALASVTYLISFQNGRYQEAIGNLAFGLFIAATLVITAALAAVVGQESYESISGLLLTGALGWITVGGHVQFQMRMVGAFVAPLATLILLIQFFVAPPGATSPESADAPILMSVHVAMAVVGQAFAIISCAVSLLFLWQRTLLKKKLIDQIPKNVPAMDRLEQILVLTLWAGFIFLTLGLISGAVYTQRFVPRAGLSLEFKVIWAIGVWLWYLATLLAKNVFNRPGKRIAQMSLAGFALLAVTYFGMGFFRTLGGA